MIPSVTNTEGKPTIYMPLIVIVFISMIKDIFEDLKRYRSDKEENTKKVLVYING